MKIGITLKLFLAFFVTSIIVIVVMTVAVRYSFQSGFLDYVNRVEVERLHTLARTIAQEYEKNGDWKFIKYKRGIWHRLIISHLRSSRGVSFKLENLPEDNGEQTLDLTDLGLRLALLNADKEFVAGNRQYGDDAVLKPIVIASGETVGWLSITPSTELVDTVDIQFKEQQNNTAILISYISIFFAAMVAVVFAQHLLKPIKQLVDATRALAAGRFNTRINVNGVDEIGQLQNDFNSLAHTLERNEQSRRQWIADISHELRTPMAVLLGEVEAIQDGVRQASYNNLESLHSEILRVNQLIDDLYQLSMSDIGALDYRKEPVELGDVLEKVITTFKDKLRERGIEAHIDYDPSQSLVIFADAQRLFQLFSNLLQNTLRYTNAGGRCEITCKRTHQEVTVNWQDSEPGVPDHLLENLFERLFRAEESRNRESGGAGLGLAICKNITEAHDGEISVRHSPLGGLWFQVRFPAMSTKSRWFHDEKLKRA
ncbi:MAG: ATP-binding protein [Gammaproteobacteria bacterium]|jgi:two-component system sensor histidine kinase BaeS